MFRLAAFVIALIGVAPWLRAEVAMVHPQVPETTLSLERTKDLLLGRVTTWNDGSPVILVLIDEPSADAYLQLIIGRDHARLLRGWKRLVYTGSGAMPLVASSPTEAANLVAKYPGALALIASALPDDRCRFLPLAKILEH